MGWHQIGAEGMYFGRSCQITLAHPTKRGDRQDLDRFYREKCSFPERSPVDSPPAIARFPGCFNSIARL
jgi:hypothetical protein